MLNIVLIIGIVFFLLLVVAAATKGSSGRTSAYTYTSNQSKIIPVPPYLAETTNQPAYEAIPNLLTAAERSFFGVLQQAVATEYQIFAKVRLADIVRPVRNPSRSGWQMAFNRITGKHVDFVLCDSARLSVVAIVELDDSSHGRLERGVRDSLVDSALADAAIPVLRISARQTYSPAQIREQVKGVFVAQKENKNSASKN